MTKQLLFTFSILLSFASMGFSQPSLDQTISHSADGFGSQIDINGDYMIVGASQKAFIYKQIEGNWTFQQELTWADCPNCANSSYADTLSIDTFGNDVVRTINRVSHSYLESGFAQTMGIIEGYAFVSHLLKIDSVIVEEELDLLTGNRWEVENEYWEPYVSKTLFYKETSQGWTVVDIPEIPQGKVYDTENNSVLIGPFVETPSTVNQFYAEEFESSLYVVEKNGNTWNTSFVGSDDEFIFDDVAFFEFMADLTADATGIATSAGIVYEKNGAGTWEENRDLHDNYTDMWWVSHDHDIAFNGTGLFVPEHEDHYSVFVNELGFHYQKENGVWTKQSDEYDFTFSSFHQNRLLLGRLSEVIVNDYSTGTVVPTDTLNLASQISDMEDAGQHIAISASIEKKVYIYQLPPLEIKNLRLLSVCSPNPSVERRWRVKNPNDFPVSYIWAQWWSDQRDTLIAPPGLSFFYTQTNAQDPNTGAGLGIYGDDNITGIWWVDENNQTASAWDFPNEDLCNLRTLAQETPKKGSFLPGEIHLTFPVEDIAKREGSVKAYPNPTSGVLKIESKIPSRAKLFNLTGQLLIDSGQTHVKEEHELNLSQLPVGVYILEVSNEIQSQKIRVIKQ